MEAICERIPNHFFLKTQLKFKIIPTYNYNTDSNKNDIHIETEYPNISKLYNTNKKSSNTIVVSTGNNSKIKSHDCQNVSKTIQSPVAEFRKTSDQFLTSTLCTKTK